MFITEHGGTLVQKQQQKWNKIPCILCLTPSYVPDIKWSPQTLKFSCISCKIFSSNRGEPSRSTFDAQSLLFGLRSRHDCGNTIISFVLLSVWTIWAAKQRAEVHHCTKTSRLPSNRSSDTSNLWTIVEQHFALTKCWPSKRQLSKSFTVVIQLLSTRLIKPNFCFEQQ